MNNNNNKYKAYSKPRHKWPIITDKIIKSTIEYLRGGTLGEYEEESGPLIEFEQEFSAYIGVNKSLLCSSGTSALLSAYFAIGIQPDDEVLVPAFTFVATVSPLLFLGAKIVFVECENENGNINLNDLSKKITQKTKAIVVTHNGGVPVNMGPIMRLKKQYGFSLIEDCARALGSEYRGKRVGSFGDISCFSLQEKKIVFGGEGGIATTNNDSLYERMVLLGHYFRSRSQTHINIDANKIFSETGLGLNLSIHPLAAIIAKESFNSLEDTISSRYQAIEAFKLELSKRKVLSIKPTRIPDFCTKISYYHCVTIYNSLILQGLSRDVFVAELKKRGVDARISDNKPLYRFPLFQKAGDRIFGKLFCNSCVEPNEITPADIFFNSIIIFPPIINKNIMIEYAQIIAEVEKYFRKNYRG